ncbi:response regulator transcription factor [Paractinoplanes brasiliensis]|uniref:helix-turn-helix transcriptional regulator n=1 Tax=Paractinoplanes brasiliensis TaxID=52695 RepID=UPI003F68FE0C
MLRPAERNDAHVLVFAYEQVSAEVVTVLRRTALETGLPVVLVVNAITESELLVAIENRVVAILPRGAVSAERLVHSVTTAAAGGGVLPPNMVGELLKHIERLQREVLAPNGLNASGLTPREVDVLRLMADGKDTQEIAGELCYSERTVKNVIHNLTHRLKLRNRSHAVAYALRAGMI